LPMRYKYGVHNASLPPVGCRRQGRVGWQNAGMFSVLRLGSGEKYPSFFSKKVKFS